MYYATMAMTGAVSKLSGAFSTLQTVLFQAIQKNDQASVEKLLNACSSKIPAARITDPLHLAIKQNRVEIVKLLLSKGACVRSPLNCFKQNALHIAAMHRNKEVIMHILESKADWNAVDVDDANVIHLVLMGTDGARYEDDFNKPITTKDEQRVIIEILQVFVNLGLDVNECSKFGESPLELAIRSGMTDVAKFLIRSGANPYVYDRRGERISHMLIRYAIRENNKNKTLTRNRVCTKSRILDFMTWLQSEGLEINIASIDEVTPLQLAIKHRLDTMVPILMGLGDSSFRNTHGQGSLHIALAKYYDSQLDFGDRDDNSVIVILVRRMLNGGADVNVVNNSGNTPLHIAAKQKNHQLIQMMLEHFTNVDAQSYWGETVLHILISDSVDANGKFEKDYERYVDALLLRGADANLKNGKGMTPAQLAIQKKSAGILKVLANYGADLKVRTEDGDDLFQLLVRSSVKVDEPEVYENIIDVLISNGFGIYELAKNGHEFLHQATLWGNLSLIKALLKKGADVNSKDNSLRRLTPLHIAIQYRPVQVIETFLKSGADVNILTEDGESPLNMVIKKGYVTLVKSLLKAGAKVNTVNRNGDSPLLLAVRKGGSSGIELTKLLLDHGGDVHFCNKKLTPLHVAAETNQLEVIKLLVKAGIDVNARNEFGETPLHLAARHKNSMLKYLINSGGEIYLLDNKNRLPLHNAFESDNLVGLHSLILAGQDVNELGHVQWTKMFKSLEKAYVEEKIHVVRHLIKLHVIGLIVPRLDEDYIENYDGKRKECMEVKELKMARIGQVSLYEFVHMNLKQRIIHAKEVQNLECYSIFPVYEFLIKQKVEEAIERKELLKSAVLVWYEISNFMLPDLCLDIIFDHVNNDVLKRFIKSAEPKPVLKTFSQRSLA